MKPSILKTSTKILNNQTLAIGAKINGTKNTGFKTIGAPNKKGSLTLNSTGIELAFPIAFNSFDLARKANIKQITRVAPVPPKQTTNYCAPKVKTLSACCPAWTAAKLVDIFKTNAAEIAGSTIDGPWTPINQNKDIAP